MSNRNNKKLKSYRTYDTDDKSFVEKDGRIWIYKKLNNGTEKFEQTSYTPEDMNNMIKDGMGVVHYDSFKTDGFPVYNVRYGLGETPTPEEEAEIQKMDEDIEGEYRCKSMGMEWVSGHHRYRNGRRIAYVAGHCRKIASGHRRVR